MTSITDDNNTKHWLAKKVPFFYGWLIAPISIIAILGTSPGQTYMISVFNPRFLSDLGISLSQLSWAYMAGTFIASLPQSFLGKWIDKVGWRKMLIIITILFSLACIYTSTVQNLFMLFIAFLLLRMLGQGALNLIGTNMLAMWFKERLGTIAGVSGVVVSLIMGLIPIGTLTLINHVGWRKAYIISGLIVLVVILPIAIFIYISRPEDIGNNVDNKQFTNDQKENILNETKEFFSLREAIRTPPFWILTSVASVWAAIATAITFNILPIFTGKGLSEMQAAATFTYLSVVVAITRIVGGYLADKIPLNYLTMLGVFAYCGGTSALLLLPNSSVVIVYTLLAGTAQGLLNGVFSTVLVRYFGRENLGKIYGVVWTATAAGSSLGPLLMGLLFDNFGNYRISLMIFSGLLFILAIASFWATTPIKKHELVG